MKQRASSHLRRLNRSVSSGGAPDNGATGEQEYVKLNIHFTFDDRTNSRLRALNETIRTEHDGVDIDFQKHLPHLTLFSSYFHSESVTQVKTAALDAAGRYFGGDRESPLSCQLLKWELDPFGYVFLQVDKKDIEEGANAIVESVQDFVHPYAKAHQSPWIRRIESMEARRRKLFYLRTYGSPNVYDEFDPHVTIAFQPNMDVKALERSMGEILGPRGATLEWKLNIQQLRFATPLELGILPDPDASPEITTASEPRSEEAAVATATGERDVWGEEAAEISSSEAGVVADGDEEELSPEPLSRELWVPKDGPGSSSVAFNVHVSSHVLSKLIHPGSPSGKAHDHEDSLPGAKGSGAPLSELLQLGSGGKTKMGTPSEAAEGGAQSYSKQKTAKQQELRGMPDSLLQWLEQIKETGEEEERESAAFFLEQDYDALGLLDETDEGLLSVCKTRGRTLRMRRFLNTHKEKIEKYANAAKQNRRERVDEPFTANLDAKPAEEETTENVSDVGETSVKDMERAVEELVRRNVAFRIMLLLKRNKGKLSLSALSLAYKKKFYKSLPESLKAQQGTLATRLRKICPEEYIAIDKLPANTDPEQDEGEGKRGARNEAVQIRIATKNGNKDLSAILQRFKAEKVNQLMTDLGRNKKKLTDCVRSLDKREAILNELKSINDQKTYDRASSERFATLFKELQRYLPGMWDSARPRIWYLNQLIHARYHQQAAKYFLHLLKSVEYLQHPLLSQSLVDSKGFNESMVTEIFKQIENADEETEAEKLFTATLICLFEQILRKPDLAAENRFFKLVMRSSSQSGRRFARTCEHLANNARLRMLKVLLQTYMKSDSFEERVVAGILRNRVIANKLTKLDDFFAERLKGEGLVALCSHQAPKNAELYYQMADYHLRKKKNYGVAIQWIEELLYKLCRHQQSRLGVKVINLADEEDGEEEEEEDIVLRMSARTVWLRCWEFVVKLMEDARKRNLPLKSRVSRHILVLMIQAPPVVWRGDNRFADFVLLLHRMISEEERSRKTEPCMLSSKACRHSYLFHVVRLFGHLGEDKVLGPLSSWLERQHENQRIILQNVLAVLIIASKERNSGRGEESKHTFASEDQEFYLKSPSASFEEPLIESGGLVEKICQDYVNVGLEQPELKFRLAVLDRVTRLYKECHCLKASRPYAQLLMRGVPEAMKEKVLNTKMTYSNVSVRELIEGAEMGGASDGQDSSGNETKGSESDSAGVQSQPSESSASSEDAKIIENARV